MSKQQDWERMIGHNYGSRRVVVADLVADLTAIRTALVNLGAKMDLDGGVDDVDYEDTITADLGDQRTQE